jgi:hypothetical protein
MVLRDEEGSILFTACRFLQTCDSPLEAELLACSEGLALALENTNKPIILESDCLEAISMINDDNRNRSFVASLVNEVKKLCGEGRECRVQHISRELNTVSHTLARWGLATPSTMFWRRHGPDIIRSACNQDGTSMP